MINANSNAEKNIVLVNFKNKSVFEIEIAFTYNKKKMKKNEGNN